MRATHSKTPFWKALLLLSGMGVAMGLPVYTHTPFPNWIEVLLYVGIPVICCILLLYIGERQPAYRLPLIGLLILPVVILEGLMEFGRFGGTWNVASAFVTGMAYIGLSILYTLRTQKRTHKPRLVWIKWGMACLTGFLSGMVLLIVALGDGLAVPYISALAAWARANENVLIALTLTISGGMLGFILLHLIDLWKFGPTYPTHDYHQLIDEIATAPKEE